MQLSLATKYRLKGVITSIPDATSGRIIHERFLRRSLCL